MKTILPILIFSALLHDVPAKADSRTVRDGIYQAYTDAADVDVQTLRKAISVSVLSNGLQQTMTAIASLPERFAKTNERQRMASVIRELSMRTQYVVYLVSYDETDMPISEAVARLQALKQAASTNGFAAIDGALRRAADGEKPPLRNCGEFHVIKESNPLSDASWNTHPWLDMTGENADLLLGSVAKTNMAIVVTTGSPNAIETVGDAEVSMSMFRFAWLIYVKERYQPKN